MCYMSVIHMHFHYIDQTAPRSTGTSTAASILHALYYNIYALFPSSRISTTTVAAQDMGITNPQGSYDPPAGKSMLVSWDHKQMPLLFKYLGVCYSLEIIL